MRRGIPLYEYRSLTKDLQWVYDKQGKVPAGYAESQHPFVSNFMVQGMTALFLLYANDIVHRDITLANFLISVETVSSEGLFKLLLIDFGLASKLTDQRLSLTEDHWYSSPYLEDRIMSLQGRSPFQGTRD